MLKIGEFIYPWGSGHYSRMMRLNDALSITMKNELEVHFSSKDHVIEKLLKKYSKNVFFKKSYPLLEDAFTAEDIFQSIEVILSKKIGRAHV